MKLEELIKSIEDYLIAIHGNSGINIASIEYDSRKIIRNSAFIAIDGADADGHLYIKKAIENNANAIICEKLPENLEDNICYVMVSNTRKALALLAEAFYGFPTKHLKVIGITGTNGKTTISFLLQSIFNNTNRPSGVVGTTGIFYDDEKIEIPNTTPDPITLSKNFEKMLEKGIRYVFMEVSSHALVQDRTAGINFDGAIFTNLTHEHLDYHKTIDEYAMAKKILFQSLNEDNFAIVNDDDAHGRIMLEHIFAKPITVGHSKEADYSITKDTVSPLSIKFKINKRWINAPLIGDFNIDNAALVFACAKAMGIKTGKIIKAMKKVVGAPGRMERVDIRNGAVAFVDYAHTPDALEKALFTCRKIKNEDSRLIAIVGCGGDRDKTKRSIMGRLVARFADVPIITSDNPRTEDPNAIIRDMVDGIPPASKSEVIIESDRRAAIKKACEISKKGDFILLAGKGHETYQIIGKEKVYFFDIDELMDYKI